MKNHTMMMRGFLFLAANMVGIGTNRRGVVQAFISPSRYGPMVAFWVVVVL
jgi:hypothetical protein